jgi:hypothetical protein
VVAVRRAGRIRHGRGSKATLSASDYPALFDGKDLDPVVAKEDVIAYRLADQGARDGRDIGDRSRSRIGFVFPDYPERLPPAVVANERHPGTERDRVALDRIRHQLSGPETLREIPHVPRRRGDRVAARPPARRGRSP